MTVIRYPTIDGQRGADVLLSGVEAPRRRAARGEGEGTASIEEVGRLRPGRGRLCAEAVGVLQATLDATTEYTQTRKQFGVPIARFQALQHRMADMLMHVEQARSMSYLAAMHASLARRGRAAPRWSRRPRSRWARPAATWGSRRSSSTAAWASPTSSR